MSNMMQNQSSQNEPEFSLQENLFWRKLYTKQLNNLQKKAFPQFLENIKKFNLPVDRVSKLSVISEKFKDATDWQVAPVSGLIGCEAYFTLLSQRKFSCATFISSEYEENLSKDPDIFHEVFGHCTMLVSPAYTFFMEEFAKFALTLKRIDRPLFVRLIWFTTETGLINTNKGIRIYGSSLLSSYIESTYCLESKEPILKPFNIVDIFREPYRTNFLQKVYYVIDDISQVYPLLNDTSELYKAVDVARKKGEFPAFFPVEYNKYTNIGHCVPVNVVRN